jgi:hypothetical protein
MKTNSFGEEIKVKKRKSQREELKRSVITSIDKQNIIINYDKRKRKLTEIASINRNLIIKGSTIGLAALASHCERC